MQMNNEVEQVSLFDQDFYAGRMFPALSQAENHKAKISGLFWRKSAELKAVPYQFLDLTPGAGNLLGQSYWDVISPWHGGVLMHNTGVSPRDEKESSLSQILQEQVPIKYYLTPKACRGILRRAHERDKALPQQLEKALMIQAGFEQVSIEAGCNGVLCLNDQGGRVMECTEGISGTLRAQEHGHQPLVFENHGIDSRYTGPHRVAPTMSARYGTGGNNVPLVAQEETPIICITGNAIDRQPQNGGNGIGYQKNIAYTLTATDHHAVFSRQRVDVFADSDIASTQSAGQHKDTTHLIYQETVGTLTSSDHKGPNSQYVAQDKCVIGGAHLIRRLTPIECERLQGFPDTWTDIPGASDSARYKALGNSVAIPCVDFVLCGIARRLRSTI